MRLAELGFHDGPVRQAFERGEPVIEEFEQGLLDPGPMKVVNEDKAEAASLGITGTPGFFVNGRFLRGAKPFADFAKLINAELARLNLPIPEGAQSL